MSNAVKLDQRAFNRGVDEVLLLKPVRRAVYGILNIKSGQSSGNAQTVKPAGADFIKVEPVAEGDIPAEISEVKGVNVKAAD